MTQRAVMLGGVMLVLAAATLHAAAAPPPPIVQLVAAGASNHAIATTEQPTATEQFAARELARYIELISGAKLPVVAGDARAGTKAIRLRIRPVGATRPPNRLMPADNRHVIDVARNGAILLEGATGQSLLQAAYRFLEQLGCRFLAPELTFYAGSAEVIPRTKDIDVRIARTESQPVLAYRKLYVEEGHSHDEANLRQMIAWMPKAGYNVLVVPIDYQGSGRVKWDNWRAALTPELQRRGIIIEVGGHGYQNFLHADLPAPDGSDRKLFEARPDWFAQDANGRRQRGHQWVFNTANADAVAFLVDAVVKYVGARPEIQIFDFWPPDGARFDQSPAGVAQGTPVERVVKLTTTVQAALAKVRPDVRLEVLAYAAYVEPPKSARLSGDVLLDFCPIDQCFERQINEPGEGRNAEYAAALQSWRRQFPGDVSLYSYYRKYAWQSLPVLLPNYVQRDLEWYAGVPVQGISTYAEPGDWFTYELNHYVLARLAWNPQADVRQLIGDFCRARYGSAAPVAQRAFAVLEEVVRNFGSVMHTRLKSADEIKAAQQRLAPVVAAVRNAAEKESNPVLRAHLTRLALMCWHAEADLRVQRLRAQQAPRAELQKAVAEMHAFIVQHQHEGVFLVHGNRLSLEALMGRNRYAVPK